MKKIVIIVGLLFLSACIEPTSYFTDPKSGCEYIRAESSNGGVDIEPRMDGDKQICNSPQEKQ